MVLILPRYSHAKRPLTEKQSLCQAQCAIKTAWKWLATWRIREFSSALAASMDAQDCQRVGIPSIGLDEPKTPTPLGRQNQIERRSKKFMAKKSLAAGTCRENNSLAKYPRIGPESPLS
jgi:hypothetical protein